MTRDQLIETMARAMAPAFAEACNYWCDGLLWTECKFKNECSCRQYAFDAATAALTAIEAAGMRVVPVEPSEKMQLAGGEAQSRSIGSWGEPALVYRAMVLAAQEDSTSE